MNKKFNENEILLIGDELEKLYSFNDKHLNEIKKIHFINELECLFSVKAIIAGIKKLQTMDLKQIKMVDIKNSIRKFVEEKNLIGCSLCENTGVISVEDENENDYVFSCNCEKGRDISETNKMTKMTKWNNKNEMWIHGKKYTIKFPIGFELTEKETEIYNNLKKGKEIKEVCPW